MEAQPHAHSEQARRIRVKVAMNHSAKGVLLGDVMVTMQTKDPA